jgi:hypothetical protein
MKIAPLLLCSMLAVAPAVQAQPSPELQKRLLQLQNKPVASWKQSDYDEMEKTVLAVTREMLAAGMTPARRGRFARLALQTFDDPLAPPAWTDGRTIYLSKDALGDLIALGMYVGRDLYVRHGGRLAVPSSFLFTPYREPVLPLLPTLSGVLGRVPQQLIRCLPGKQLCAAPQGVASVLGTIAFVVAHEAAHVFLGHQNKRDHPVEEEIAADGEAFRMLIAVAPAKPEESEERGLEARVRTVVIAGPFLVLRWLRDTNARALDADAIDERTEKLIELAGDEYFGDPASLVDRKNVTRKLQNVKITWSEEPDEIRIDGVRLAPGEIAGRTLRLSAPARIAARRSGRFAFAQVSHSGEVALQFEEPSPGAVSARDLEAMQRRREWARIFLATTSPSAQPRSPDVALAFYRALDRLDLGAWIDPENIGLSAPGDTALVRHWWRDAQPLGTWRPDF